MNRKEIYSSRTYELYLNLIDKHFDMETKKEFKDVIITDKLDKELAGETMYYNEDSGLYEYRMVDEDISRTRFLKKSYLYALNPYLVEQYLKEGLVKLVEEPKGSQDIVVEETKSIDHLPKDDIKEWESGYSYKQPTELEILRDEIDGLKSTVYNLRQQFDNALDELREEFNKYHNQHKRTYNVFGRL